MRASRTMIATLRDDPGDAVVASHRLMLRAGLVRKLGSGLYHLLPLGLRVFRKIENVVRQEMDAAGGLEFQLPILTPAELWEQSERWQTMGKEMFRVRDRHETMNALGPTHEESFTDLVKGLVHSYKDLPINVYQIHTKFRDEIRPRFGVIRSREFCMKDAYSFDLDEAGLEQTYQTMRRTYRRIFGRLALQTIPVEADSGAMGGSGSEEFMVPSKIGEETLLLSEGGQYRGNQEKTPVIYAATQASKDQATAADAELEKVHTPDCKSIADVAALLKKDLKETIKSVAYFYGENANGNIADAEKKSGLVLVWIRGDRDVNEVKLSNVLEGASLRPASETEILAVGSVAGFMGPHGLSEDVRQVWDLSLKAGGAYVIGANERDYHYLDYKPGSDHEFVDLALAMAGDPSPAGDGELKEMKGIEVGHIFKLGYKYSEKFEVSVLDVNGKAVTPIMGCYGIGINRTMATIIEQNHDEMGIAWPISAAPYEVVLVSITKGAEQDAAAEKFYETMQAVGLEVLWDDRKLRPGVKFKDAELIGYPIRVTMGKGYFETGELEIQLRHEGKDALKHTIGGSIEDIIKKIKQMRRQLYQTIEAGLEE